MKVATLSCPTYSHFHLFLHLKKLLASQKFHKDEEVKNEVTTWLPAQMVEFYDTGPRLNKYLDTGGDYVNKYF